MKKILAIVAILASQTAFALSENPNAIVAKYGVTENQIGFSIESCASTNDCFFINKPTGVQQMLKSDNTTFYINSVYDVIGVESTYTLPAGFSRTYQNADSTGRGLIISTDTISNISVSAGKIKYNNTYMCLYDSGTERKMNVSGYSWLYLPRLVIGAHSNSQSYICPGTYNGFNLVDFYNANPYVAPSTNPCGLTQEEINAGVTCGGNSAGTGSTSSNELPIDAESFMFYQQAKIVITGIILFLLLVFHFFKYARD